MRLRARLTNGGNSRWTDEKDGDRRDGKGCAKEEVKPRWQPTAVEQGAARERRQYCAKPADADGPSHAGGSHRKSWFKGSPDV
jgi:hypothetical protein